MLFVQSSNLKNESEPPTFSLSSKATCQRYPFKRILLYIFIWYDSELLVKDILIVLGYLIDQIINNENNQLAEALLTNCICSNTLLNVSFVVSLSLSFTHKRYTFCTT